MHNDIIKYEQNIEQLDGEGDKVIQKNKAVLQQVSMIEQDKAGKNTISVSKKTEAEKLTISDIANELGVSKTTVSRAISGKGRIGRETVQRVMECIEKHNYKPNSFTRGLASQKTYNIGIVFPADVDVRNTPFFQRCLLGVCEVAASLDYDVVVTTVKETDINFLKRLVENKKVDGIILTRNFTSDMATAYLKQREMPFLLIGSSEDDTIVQVDNNHMEACEKLTSLLLSGGVTRIALIAGDLNHMVNRFRCEGYFNALRSHGISIEQDMVFSDCNSSVFVEQAVRYILKRQSECIVCTDDVICGRVLSMLLEEGYAVPRDIKVASLYDSIYLETSNPPVTSVGFKAEELGAVAGKRLIDLIKGDSSKYKTILDYEIHVRRST